MIPKDFVYSQVLKGAIQKGASQLYAHQRAVICVSNYLKNNYQGKVSAMIEREIKEAVRLTKFVKK